MVEGITGSKFKTFEAFNKSLNHHRLDLIVAGQRLRVYFNKDWARRKVKRVVPVQVRDAHTSQSNKDSLQA
jgi:hypothetical protein